MTTLKQLKFVNKQYKYTVFGYIREKENELLLHNIPSIISYLSLTYYFHGEYFDKYGKHLKRSKRQNDNHQHQKT